MVVALPPFTLARCLPLIR